MITPRPNTDPGRLLLALAAAPSTLEDLADALTPRPTPSAYKQLVKEAP